MTTWQRLEETVLEWRSEDGVTLRDLERACPAAAEALGFLRRGWNEGVRWPLSLGTAMYFRERNREDGHPTAPSIAS